MAEGLLEQVVNGLMMGSIYVLVARTHQDFVRLSPHFYNTEEEIDRVLEVLAPEVAAT